MPNELLDHVRDELIPMLRPPSHVVDAMRAGGGALVIVRVGDLRVQITRDRGEMRADFGSMARPHLSFDEQVVGEHLGLGRGTGFGAADLTQSMRAIASFLNAHFDELSAMFGPAQLDESRRALESLQQARVVRHAPAEAPD